MRSCKLGNATTTGAPLRSDPGLGNPHDAQRARLAPNERVRNHRYTMLFARPGENTNATSLLGTSPKPRQIANGVSKRSQIPTLRHSD